jgi:large subunit GTPase 1
MVLAKSKKSVGLGNSLMNDRFGKGKGADMRRGAFQQGIERTGQNGEKVGQPHQQSASMLMHRSISSTRRRRPTG